MSKGENPCRHRTGCSEETRRSVATFVDVLGFRGHVVVASSRSGSFFRKDSSLIPHCVRIHRDLPSEKQSGRSLNPCREKSRRRRPQPSCRIPRFARYGWEGSEQPPMAGTKSKTFPPFFPLRQ